MKSKIFILETGLHVFKCNQNASVVVVVQEVIVRMNDLVHFTEILCQLRTEIRQVERGDLSKF